MFKTFEVNIICILFSLAPDGVYNLKSNENSEIYPVYCHMSNLSINVVEGVGH